MTITALIFLLAYSYGLLKAISGKPLYGLFSYLLAFYLHPQSNFWGASLPDLRWSFIAAIVTFLVILLKNDKDKAFFKFKETKVFLIFVIYVVIQNLWAISSSSHTEYTVLAVKFLILIFLIQNTIKSQEDVVNFILVNLVGVAYFAYVGLTSDFSGRMENVGGPGIRSSNTLAQHVVVVTFFSSYLLLGKFGKKQIYALPLIALCIQVLAMAGSRSSLLALVMTGFLAIFFVPKPVKKKFYSLAIIAACGVIIAIGPFMIERFKSMAADDTGEIQDKSARSRFIIIEAQWEMFKESPIIGHGHAGTTWLSPFYIAEEYRSQGKKPSSNPNKPTYRASHNFIMTLLVDHGIIGAILYLIVIYQCFTKIFAINRFKEDSEEENNYKLLTMGFIFALVSLMIAGLGSNNKVLEIGIWLYAMIPLLTHKYMELKSNDP